jgi:hypothetical protein
MFACDYESLLARERSMKKSVNQNKSNLLDWWLSIDFDPVQVTRVRRGMPTTYASSLDAKAFEPKRGD